MDAKTVPLDQAFDRDKFLLRQQHFTIGSEKYNVWDEEQQPILFIERPGHFLRSFLGILGALGASVIVLSIFIAIGSLFGESVIAGLFYILAFLGFLFTLFALAIVLTPKRHVTIYRDKSRQEKLLEIFQEHKWQFPYAYYEVKDPQEGKIARLKKNYLYDIIRKRWDCYLSDGSLLCKVMEDSIEKALLRRFLGNLFGILRTNFVFLAGRTERLVGEFNRKFTLFDRYVLDMSADPERVIDRRIAIAIGVMLDTGERR